MASILARRACSQLSASNSLHRAVLTRAIHSSPVALKKRRTAALEESLSFDNEEPEEDIFGDSKTSTTSSQAPGIAQATKQPARNKLAPHDRTQRFEQLHEFVAPRVGPKPLKNPQVRKSAWVHLIGLANSEEELSRVAELFPQWNSSRKKFEESTVELFARRCAQLHCPNLALSVFGNYGKYGLFLTLPAARQMLRAYHVSQPLKISDLIAVSALYDVYNLPPVSEDLISCSLLTSACLQDGSKDALVLADALLPFLKRGWKGAEDASTEKAGSASGSTKGASGIRPDTKDSKWFNWTVRKIYSSMAKRFGKEAEDVAWIKAAAL